MQETIAEENRAPLLTAPPVLDVTSVNLLQTKEVSQSEKIHKDEIMIEHKEDSIYKLPTNENVTDEVLRKLFLASIVALIFLISEVIGGMLAHSLAILSDAAHMFSDLSGFMISIFSIWIAKRASTPKLSYGYHRSEVIGALASIFIIWALTVVLLFEATTRIIDRTPVENPAIMLITATAGLVFNIVMAKILHSAPGHSHHGCDHGHSHGDEHAHGDDHKHEKEHAHKHDNHDHAHKQQYQGKHEHKHGPEHKKKKNHAHKHVHEGEHHHHHENESVQTGLINPDVDKASIQQEIDPRESTVSLFSVLGEGEQNGHQHNGEADEENQYLDDAAVENSIKKQKEKKKKHSHDHDHGHDHGHGHGHDHGHDHGHGHSHGKSENKNLSVMKASDNYNLRAAMIHVIGDILQSVGVLLAAILIFFFGDNGESWNPWHLADPICTYIFSILVMFTTFHISRDCILVLMEGTPREIDPIEFKTKLYNIAHVVAIHDLHIWSMSMGKPLISVHIIVDSKVNEEEVLVQSTRLCRQYGIYHSSIQIESEERVDKEGYIKCLQNIHHDIIRV